MQDKDKTKEQLLRELEDLRQRIVELGEQEVMRRQAEADLRDIAAKYRSLVDSTEDSIYLVDSTYQYLYMNKKHLVRLGLLGDQFLGQAYRKFHSPQETREFIKKVDQVFKTGESIQYEHKSRRDGRYFLRTLSPVKEQSGKTAAVTIVSKDISELKHMEESLRALSLTDELTDLYNRRGFVAMAGQQLKTAKRLRYGALLLSADLDNLKRINDAHGHSEGDSALIQAAHILKKTFREPDIIGRIGGDEFAVLLMESTATDSMMLAARLQKELDIWNATGERDYTLSFSIGITRCAPDCQFSIEELLSQADKLMYENKRSKNKT
jgi:diguanylate cyclase (GGDEF)-like protein/PAS domain S-box-containing protein